MHHAHGRMWVAFATAARNRVTVGARRAGLCTIRETRVFDDNWYIDGPPYVFAARGVVAKRFSVWR